jgi:hypothetical protein
MDSPGTHAAGEKGTLLPPLSPGSPARRGDKKTPRRSRPDTGSSSICAPRLRGSGEPFATWKPGQYSFKPQQPHLDVQKTRQGPSLDSSYARMAYDHAPWLERKGTSPPRRTTPGFYSRVPGSFAHGDASRATMHQQAFDSSCMEHELYGGGVTSYLSPRSFVSASRPAGLTTSHLDSPHAYRCEQIEERDQGYQHGHFGRDVYFTDQFNNTAKQSHMINLRNIGMLVK